MRMQTNAEPSDALVLFGATGDLAYERYASLTTNEPRTWRPTKAATVSPACGRHDPSMEPVPLRGAQPTFQFAAAAAGAEA